MYQYVIYDTESGRIQRTIRGPSIDPDQHGVANGEAMVSVDPKINLAHKVIDLDTEDPIDDPDNTPTHLSIARNRVSQSTKDALAQARDDLQAARVAADQQAQIDALEVMNSHLIDILTGETLDEL